MLKDNDLPLSQKIKRTVFAATILGGSIFGTACSTPTKAQSVENSNRPAVAIAPTPTPSIIRTECANLALEGQPQLVGQNPSILTVGISNIHQTERSAQIRIAVEPNILRTIPINYTLPFNDQMDLVMISEKPQIYDSGGKQSDYPKIAIHYHFKSDNTLRSPQTRASLLEGLDNVNVPNSKPDQCDVINLTVTGRMPSLSVNGENLIDIKPAPLDPKNPSALPPTA